MVEKKITQTAVDIPDYSTLCTFSSILTAAPAGAAG